jgi:hypothetical protein
MLNFCDAYSGERDFYFLVRPHDPVEVASALKEYHRKNKHRLKDGKIWTENSKAMSSMVLEE